MEVRPIEPADVPAVIDLVTRTLAEFGLEFGVGSRTDQELLDLPGSYTDHGGAFWIASASDGRMLGTCGVARVDGGVFELRKMYLDPASRGVGLGARLLDTAVTWTREHGGTMLVLDTTEAMTRAISFYEAHGFVRDDTHIRGSRCSRGYKRALAAV